MTLRECIVAFVLLTVLAAADVCAQPTIAGVWKTIDDSTGRPRALVRISEENGVFTGRIEQLLDDTPPEATCKACTDERRKQPIVGMTILRNIRKNPSAADLWDGGEILDPENGKEYRVRLKPVADGAKLELRGYIGFPLLGRTQTWLRAE